MGRASSGFSVASDEEKYTPGDDRMIIGTDASRRGRESVCGWVAGAQLCARGLALHRRFGGVFKDRELLLC